VNECKALTDGPISIAGAAATLAEVGRCRLSVSKPVLKGSMVSALETTM
jgi:hypothetical protein